MDKTIWVLIVPLLFASGCCCQDGEWEYSHETDDVNNNAPGGGAGGYPENGVGGLPVLTVEDAVISFKDALVAGEPDYIIALTADNIMIGEPYSEGTWIPRSDFAKMLSDPESPFTKSLFSKERVSSFVNEHKMGTLAIDDLSDGGKSVSTEAMDWYLEFRQAESDFDNQWEMTICAVTFINSDG